MSSEWAQKFVQPTWSDMLMMVLACDFMFVLFAIYAEELIDYRAAPVAIAAIYLLMLVLMAGAEIQLVTIDGPVVCIRNAASTLRRRVFNVAEVARIEYSDGMQGGLGQHLVVHLNPAPHRSWDCVRLWALTSKGVSSPLFVAFMCAVAQVHPGLEVNKLPQHFMRGLPARASPQASKASTKPRAGARKRPRKVHGKTTR